MAEETKKGFFSKIFGTRNSGCCNIRIEEIKEEPAKTGDDEKQDPTKEQPQADSATPKPRRPSCCG